MACNPQLLQETSRKLKLPKEQVKEVIEFTSEFIADTITEGIFETVMVPYFGKFSVKTKQLQFIENRKGIDNGNKR